MFNFDEARVSETEMKDKEPACITVGRTAAILPEDLRELETKHVKVPQRINFNLQTEYQPTYSKCDARLVEWANEIF